MLKNKIFTDLLLDGCFNYKMDVKDEKVHSDFIITILYPSVEEGGKTPLQKSWIASLWDLQNYGEIFLSIFYKI